MSIRMTAWIPAERGLDLIGQVPSEVRVEVWDPAGPMPSDPAGVRFWTPPFPGQVSTDLPLLLPDLQVIQLLSAGADTWADHVPDGVTLCDATGAHTAPTAEWVVGAILSALRDFPRFALAQADGRWDRHVADELSGKKVLIVGAGDIGEATARRLQPFEVELTRVARRVRPGPPVVHPVGALPELLPAADVVVLLVPLTDETRGLADAAFLARMADGALLVNAARGPVVDTDALLAELLGGRLRAAVDVTDPEPLPTGHPLWSAPNLLITPHVGGAVPGMARRAFALVGEQLRRFAAGAPLHNVVRDGY